MNMTKNKTSIGSIASILNLASSTITLSSNTEKTMDLSSYKNKELLKSSEKLMLKQKIRKHK